MPVNYDQDADQVHAPGGHDSLGVHPEHAEAEVADLEKQYAADSAPEPKTGKSTDSSELKQDEEAPDRSGFSAADDINEKLGKGYTGKGSTKSKGLAKLYGSNSKLKKKIAIAGAAAGGSTLLGIIIFFAMLPLKIEHIVDNLDSKFGAASQQAIGSETENFYRSYVASHVLPNLNKPGCHTTKDPGCVFVAPGTGAVGKLYAAWSQGNLEQKLASKYGIVISSTGNTGGYNLTTQGHSYKINGTNVWDITGTHGASTNEVRQSIRTALKDTTTYDKVFFRFKLGKLLEAKYGIKRCIIACKIRDNFSDTVKNKKAAAEAYLAQRVVSPLSDSYGLIIQCIIDPSPCGTSPDPVSSTPDKNGNEERTSPLQKSLQTQLDAFAEQFGKDALDKLVKDAKAISDAGFQKYLIAKVMSKILGTEVSTEAVDKIANPVGWLKDATKIINFVNNVGTLTKVYGYAANSAAAVSLYMSYRTVADEAKSGHMDATELGSFTDQLSALPKDSNGNSSDATATPAYQKLLGGGAPANSASIFGDLFGGAADAAVSTPTTSYKCDSGNSPTSTVCPEEDLSQGSSTANSVSNFAKSIPGWGILSNVSSTIGSLLSQECDINPLSYLNCISDLGGFVLSHIPGFSSITDLLGKAVTPLFDFITKALLPSPFSDNMSGGRKFDMMAAGSDVAQNKSCQVELGCAAASDVTMAKIQNEQVAEAKQEFNSESLFSRMFDTTNSYSLVSQLAMSMPTSLSLATNSSIASLVSNPLGKFGSMLSSVFTGNHAFAADVPAPDPFGVAQNAYTSLPDDPEVYWNTHCGGNGTPGDMGSYDASTDTLDISAWLNNSDNTKTNDVGETVYLKTNPCQLIHSTIQSSGGAFDPSLLPQASQNNGSSSTAGSGSLSGTLGVTSWGEEVSDYKNAQGADKAELAKIALQPRSILFGPGTGPQPGTYNKQDLVNYMNTFNQNDIAEITLFSEWENGEGDQAPLSSGYTAKAHQWISDVISAIGNRNTIVILNADLPVAMQNGGTGVNMSLPKAGSRAALTAYEAQLLAQHPNIHTYIEAGDSDWLTVNAASTMLEASGIQYTQGFAIGFSHYADTSKDITYSAQISQKLATDGFSGKQAVVDTAAHGTGFDWGNASHPSPGTKVTLPRSCDTNAVGGCGANVSIFDNPPICPSTYQVCVTLGQPPTLNVASAPGLTPAAQADAHYIDGLLWFSRPWKDLQAAPYNPWRARQLGKSALHQ